MKNHSYFANLGNPSRVWAIPAINGQSLRLNELHNMIWQNFTAGDKLIYLGNYLGTHENQTQPDTIDAINLFKSALIEAHGANENDIIRLRGAHEEMLQKILQLQFANRPHEVLSWMLGKGIESILNHYGSSAYDGLSACRSGTISLTRWTSQLRQNVRRLHGHEKFYNTLKRAAFTHSENTDDGILFVNAGLDCNRPLYAQKDSFWWAGHKFDQMSHAYDPFKCVIRGYDPLHKGVYIGDIKISLDDSSDMGGSLVCATISANGEILNLTSA